MSWSVVAHPAGHDHTPLNDEGSDMPKQRPADILERRQTADPRWVKPRKQRQTGPNRFHRPRGKVLPVSCLRDDTEWPPTLIFERTAWGAPATWVVPAVRVPMYYFDEWMLRKQLVIFKWPDTFLVAGSDRVFKLVAREQVHRTFLNRYVVVELRSDLPHNGLP